MARPTTLTCRCRFPDSRARSAAQYLPIFLVTVFTKNDRDNLGRAEQADLVASAKALVGRYGDEQ